jgi:hypothetical protein
MLAAVATGAFAVMGGSIMQQPPAAGTRNARQEKDKEDEKALAASAEAVVRRLYDLITFDRGATPDWDAVRSLFLEQAVIVLRTSRTDTTVFSREGFVQDFVNFIERANVEEKGFTERIVRMKPMVFGDLAHVLVLYEAHVNGSPRPPQPGVDSFQLARRDGEWKIVSVVNEIPSPDRPVPAILQD